jgi:hypothetical protein
VIPTDLEQSRWWLLGLPEICQSASYVLSRCSARRVALLVLLVLALIPAVPMAWAFAQSSASPGGAANVTGGNGSCT